MLGTLEMGPIIRSLTRNKTGAVLIALQIAVTMAIVLNAVFIIGERNDLIARVSGVDEANSFQISSTGFASDFNHMQTLEQDLLDIRAIPGVVAVTTINAIPTSGSGWSMSLQTESGENKTDVGTAVYMVDQNGIEALSVELIAGSNFSENEIRYRDGNQEGWPQNIIITKALANDMFPELDYAEVVGKTVYINYTEPMQIIGIIDQLQAPWIGWNKLENAMLSPEHIASGDFSRYFVRTEPGMRDDIMLQVEELLAKRANERLVEGLRSFEEVRERSYSRHEAMIQILFVVMITLVSITGKGIVGLASFNVNRRRKQIGTRRALGASKAQIIRYFMVENFLITTFGIVLGMAMTMGLNMTLVSVFELGRMNLMYLPLGAICFWLLGQLAVFGPAIKAASTPPALATRTV
ncbi:MAG: FtsX-like permease family protein [Alteromonadaceae bacterium]|nr:FtsX-like permease family protein [Alteromonadaceae bacterium]